MALIVQKFGGTSVADPRKIVRCARRVAEARKHGHEVVVVVSAMGHATDELIALAVEVGEVAQKEARRHAPGISTKARSGGKSSVPSCPDGFVPSSREMDMLMSTGEQVTIALMAMAIQSLGFDAVSMTGGQMGMLTDAVHGRAKILSIDVERIHRELKAGRVVVAAGFQGVSDDGQITTLGRGGSDATAVALAAALGEEARRHEGTKARSADDPSLPTCLRGSVPVLCEIYTDVDGVFTADPRIVSNARKLDRISYEEMLELASSGAAVMQTRSVMFGQKFGVPIHVRHSAKPGTGTLIARETVEMEDIIVAGCALKKDLGRISLRRIPNRPGVQGMLFNLIAATNVIVDDIIQTTHEESASLSFTVDHHDLADVKIAANKAIEQLGAGELTVEVGLAKVSVAGVGMRSHSGVAATMFKALGEAKIPIANITTSEIKISCIVPKEFGEKALQVVHDAFELDKPNGGRVGSFNAGEPKATVRAPVRAV